MRSVVIWRRSPSEPRTVGCLFAPLRSRRLAFGCEIRLRARWCVRAVVRAVVVRNVAALTAQATDILKLKVADGPLRPRSAAAKPATTRAQFDESCRLGPRVIEAASPLQSGCTNVACNLAYEVAENRRLKKQLADALAAKDRAEHACDRLNKKGAELTDAHNELVEWVNEATSLAQACYMVGAEGEVRKLLKFVRKE